MSVVTMLDVLHAVAERIGRLPELDYRAAYPGPNRIPASPFVVVREGVDVPTTYTKARAGEWLVLGSIEAIVLVEQVEGNARPRDEAKIDPIVPRLLSLFDGAPPNILMPDLPGHVDRIWHESRVRRGVLTYGQQGCYAAVIPMNAKFHTRAIDLDNELLPEVTP